MIITVDKIMSLNPCEDYPPVRVAALFGGGLTLEQICDLKIPWEDRIWALVQLVPEAVFIRFACACAVQASEYTTPTVLPYYQDLLRSLEYIKAYSETLDVAKRQMAHFLASKALQGVVSWLDSPNHAAVTAAYIATSDTVKIHTIAPVARWAVIAAKRSEQNNPIEVHNRASAEAQAVQTEIFKSLLLEAGL